MPGQIDIKVKATDEASMTLGQVVAELKEVQAQLKKTRESGEGSDFFSNLRKGLGRRSAFGESAELLQGKGPIAGLNAGAEAAKKLAEGLGEVEKMLLAGDVSAGQMVDKIAEGLPVIGQWWQAGEALRDVFSNQKEILEAINAEDRAADAALKSMHDAARILADDHRDTLKSVEAAQHAIQMALAPLEMQKKLQLEYAAAVKQAADEQDRLNKLRAVAAANQPTKDALNAADKTAHAAENKAGLVSGILNSGFGRTVRAASPLLEGVAIWTAGDEEAARQEQQRIAQLRATAQKAEAAENARINEEAEKQKKADAEAASAEQKRHEEDEENAFLAKKEAANQEYQKRRRDGTAAEQAAEAEAQGRGEEARQIKSRAALEKELAEAGEAAKKRREEIYSALRGGTIDDSQAGKEIGRINAQAADEARSIQARHAAEETMAARDYADKQKQLDEQLAGQKIQHLREAAEAGDKGAANQVRMEELKLKYAQERVKLEHDLREADAGHREKIQQQLAGLGREQKEAETREREKLNEETMRTGLSARAAFGDTRAAQALKRLDIDKQYKEARFALEAQLRDASGSQKKGIMDQIDSLALFHRQALANVGNDPNALMRRAGVVDMSHSSGRNEAFNARMSSIAKTPMDRLADKAAATVDLLKTIRDNLGAVHGKLPGVYSGSGR